MLSSFSNTSIFRRGSTTYYTASLFFPENIKKDVFILYAFVRTADDFVDQVPADVEKLYAFVELTSELWERRSSAFNPQGHQRPVVASSASLMTADSSTRSVSPDEQHVIEDFVDMAHNREIKWEWVRAFLKAMEADLYKKTYRTITETNTYMYGSAEVIGLMLLKIFGSPDEAQESARSLGRAMQLVNMIRDVAEDEQLGRTYLPTVEAEWCHLHSITRMEALENPHAFSHIMRIQLGRYAELMWRARHGFAYLPKELRIPVEIASDMYDWTARAIWNDPMIVWQKKLKPSKIRVASRGFQLWFSTIFN